VTGILWTHLPRRRGPQSFPKAAGCGVCRWGPAPHVNKKSCACFLKNALSDTYRIHDVFVSHRNMFDFRVYIVQCKAPAHGPLSPPALSYSPRLTNSRSYPEARITPTPVQIYRLLPVGLRIVIPSVSPQSTLPKHILSRRLHQLCTCVLYCNAKHWPGGSPSVLSPIPRSGGPGLVPADDRNPDSALEQFHWLLWLESRVGLTVLFFRLRPCSRRFGSGCGKVFYGC